MVRGLFFFVFVFVWGSTFHSLQLRFNAFINYKNSKIPRYDMDNDIHWKKKKSHRYNNRESWPHGHMDRSVLRFPMSNEFHTFLDNRCVTQNSGVCTERDHEGEMHNFYDHVCKNWELKYVFRHKVVLY